MLHFPMPRSLFERTEICPKSIPTLKSWVSNGKSTITCSWANQNVGTIRWALCLYFSVHLFALHRTSASNRNWVPSGISPVLVHFENFSFLLTWLTMLSVSMLLSFILSLYASLASSLSSIKLNHPSNELRWIETWREPSVAYCLSAVPSRNRFSVGSISNRTGSFQRQWHVRGTPWTTAFQSRPSTLVLFAYVFRTQMGARQTSMKPQPPHRRRYCAIRSNWLVACEFGPAQGRNMLNRTEQQTHTQHERGCWSKDILGVREQWNERMVAVVEENK